MAKHSLIWTALTTSLIATGSMMGCAVGEVDQFDGGGSRAEGGAAAIGGAGGDTSQSACSIDCSTIATQQCMTSVCNEATGQCEVLSSEAGVACDDGVFCTVNDSCDEGVCVGGPLNTCGLAAGECDEITCDEGTQMCSTAPLPSGADCTPADLCQVGGTCTNGQCVGVTKDCFFSPVPNECYIAVCNPQNGICEPVPGNSGGECLDSNELCTVGKTCDNAGNCIGGGPKDCSHLSVGCQDGVCDVPSGQCVPVPIADGMPCMQATDDCNEGICAAGSCDPNPINEGNSCDDGLPCTSGTTCQAGNCSGGTSSNSIFLAETFETNNAGWTLDSEWAIGPASPSAAPGSCGNGDPSTDFTPTQDNGLAGVVIGGNASTTTHGYYYLTSPVFDAASASTLFLEYYRWLNSDYPSFMTNQVEVFDGSTWQQVWWGPQTSTPITDNAWMPYSLDISAYANANMQVRFGFEIGSTGVYTCSQWNVDQVIISDQQCQ